MPHSPPSTQPRSALWLPVLTVVVAALAGAAATTLSDAFRTIAFTTIWLALAGVTFSIRWIDRQASLTEAADPFSTIRLVTTYIALNGLLGSLYFLNNQDSQLRYGYDGSSLTIAFCIYTAWLIFTLVSYRATARVVRTFIPAALSQTRRLSVPATLTLLTLGWAARVQEIAAGRYFHVSDSLTLSAGTSSTFWITSFAELPTFIALLILCFRRSSNFITWGLLLGEFAWALPTGARADVVSLLLAIVICLRYTSREFKMRWVAIAVVLAIMAFPLIAAYRSSLSYASDQQAQASIGDLAVDNVFDSVVGRFSDLEASATALSSGSNNDYFTADTFTSLTFASFVPRVLWPTKPDANEVGNSFGRATGIISPVDYATSINLPLPLMWWLISGPIGVVVGGLFCGGLFQIVNRITSGRARSPTAAALYATFALQILTLPATVLQAGLFGLLKSGSLIFLSALILTRAGDTHD